MHVGHKYSAPPYPESVQQLILLLQLAHVQCGTNKLIIVQTPAGDKTRQAGVKSSDTSMMPAPLLLGGHVGHVMPSGRLEFLSAFYRMVVLQLAHVQRGTNKLIIVQTSGDIKCQSRCENICRCETATLA